MTTSEREREVLRYRSEQRDLINRLYYCTQSGEGRKVRREIEQRLNELDRKLVGLSEYTTGRLVIHRWKMSIPTTDFGFWLRGNSMKLPSKQEAEAVAQQLSTNSQRRNIQIVQIQNGWLVTYEYWKR